MLDSRGFFSTFAIRAHYADGRMKLVEQWRRIREQLPPDWDEARLTLSVPRPDQRARVAALLGPAGPGLSEEGLNLSVRRAGGGIGPEHLTKLLGKVDDEGLRGTLALRDVAARTPDERAEPEGLAEAWARELAALPPDWSDLFCELELESSDHLERGALLLAPVNPARVPGRSAFRFRVARSFGYGASPEMTARCLERLDEEGIPGRLSILHALSDTHNVDTQGPVWRVGGRAV
jgi:hypothetical protein